MSNSSSVTIPKWVLTLHSIFAPIITAACITAAGILWDMRQELTTLNTHVSFHSSQLVQIEKLKDKLQDLEIQLASISSQTQKIRQTQSSRAD